MFESFTDRSKRIMALANQEAQRFNHDHIGVEHVFLGMIKEGSGIAGNVLKGFGIDLKFSRKRVGEIIKPGPYITTMGKLPQTPRTKKLLEEAFEVAKSRKEDVVVTEHLI